MKRAGLHWHVRNGLVFIGGRPDDRPPYQTATAAEARTWLLLHEVVPLHFPDGAPLRDVLDAAGRPNPGKGERGRNLRWFHGKRTARETEALLGSTVTIDLDRAPLCTSLALVLGQVGHSFQVEDDGSISIKRGGEAVMDEAVVFDAYRVEYWGESIRMQEALAAEREAKPAGKGFGSNPGK